MTMNDRTEAVAAYAEAQGMLPDELPNEGTKAWIDLALKAREGQLEKSMAQAVDAATAADLADTEVQRLTTALDTAAAETREVKAEANRLSAELAAAGDKIAELEARPPAPDTGGGEDHPPEPSPVPSGDGFIQFTASRPIPGGVVSSGLVMANPPYVVLQTTSWVWITEEQFLAAARRLHMVQDEDGGWLVVEER